MPQGVLRQQRHTNKNNLTVVAPTHLPPQEGGDFDSAKITATGTPIFRPLKPGESLSLAYILVCSLFLLKPGGHFLAKFRRSRLKIFLAWKKIRT